MNTRLKIPLYAKVTLICVGMLAFFGMMYLAQSIIVPIVYSIILAVVLTPIVNFFVKKKMNRIVAITLTLTLVIVASLSIIGVLSSQMGMFSDSIPALTEKCHVLVHDMSIWVSQKFNIRLATVNGWVDEANGEIAKTGKTMIGRTIVNLGNVLVVVFLIPVYTFLVLFYKPLLVEFIHELFSHSKHAAINDILKTTKAIIQSYLVGLMLEAVIVAALNSGSLLLIGVDYAILLGVIGALLNVIPYIGGIIAVAMPMLIALATKSPTSALLVLVAYIIIQFVDNHYIIPTVVASKVQINALVSIIVVLAGGALWGFGGMFLAIPLTAIVKVVCDHVEALKPWGHLLGNVIKKPLIIPVSKANFQVIQN